MPVVHSAHKGFGWDRIMDSARCGHEAIGLSKPHDPTVASTGEKEQIRTIRRCIVARLYLFIDLGFWRIGKFAPPFFEGSDVVLKPLIPYHAETIQSI